MSVQDYIAKNATKLRLQLYIKDALVKRTVSKLLVKEVSEQKSQLRKAVSYIITVIFSKIPLLITS